MDLAKVEPQLSRVKGASWFPLLYKKDVMVLGQGGIGSWVSMLLSRIGCTLHIYDMDIYEAHNMTGQIVKQAHIGMRKVEAMKAIISEFSVAEVHAMAEKYDEDKPTNDIVICGFDNMAARKVAFENWKKHVDYATGGQVQVGERSDYFFQDGRLLAEQLQIFNIPGDRMDLIEKYEKEYLFDDSEVQEAECTFKQTSHCAAMIASHMVGFLTNWVSNRAAASEGKPGIRRIPFFYEYLIPANLACNEYINI